MVLSKGRIDRAAVRLIEWVTQLEGTSLIASGHRNYLFAGADSGGRANSALLQLDRHG